MRLRCLHEYTRMGRIVIAAAAVVLGACSRNDTPKAADAKADISQLRNEIAALPFDAAKAAYFFPGEFDKVSRSWESTISTDAALDTVASAHVAYLDLHQRTNAVAWISNFGGDGYEEAAQVYLRPKGGYLIAADTTSFGAGQRDAFLIEVDSDGNEVNRFVHGGAENDSAFAALALDDGYVIAGRTSSFNDWTGDAYLVRADAAGQAQWERHFGASGTDSLECLFERDDGFLAVGNTFEGGGGRNIVVAHVSNSGEVTNKTILPGEQDDWVNTGVAIPDGGIVLVGGRGTLNASEIQFLLITLNADGSVDSQKTYDLAGASTTGLTGVAMALEDGFYLLGQTMESMESSEDVVILRVQQNGDLVWNETLHADEDEYGGGIVATGDGAAVIAATTRTYGAGGSDILLVKYNAEGNEVWARTLGSTDDESARAMVLAPDGGFLIVGERGTFIEGIQDLYVVKTNAKGFSWMGAPFGAPDLVEAPEREAPGGPLPMDMPADSLEVGDEAPAIRASSWYNVPNALRDTFQPNAELHAENIGAKLLVVEFWATWCGPCKAVIPHINALKAACEGRGVVFVSLSDEDPSQVPVEEFIRSNRMQSIVGAGSPSGVPFGAWTIPHAYLIDRYGKIIWLGHPMDGLDEAIEKGLESPAE